MSDLKQTITDIISKEFAEHHPWGPDLPYPFGEYVERISPVAAVAVVAALQLQQEYDDELQTRWVTPWRPTDE